MPDNFYKVHEYGDSTLPTRNFHLLLKALSGTVAENMLLSKNPKVRLRGKILKKNSSRKYYPKTSKLESEFKANKELTNSKTNQPYVTSELENLILRGIDPITGLGLITPVSKSNMEDRIGFFGNLNDFFGTTNSRNDSNAPLWKKMVDKTLWELDSNNPSGGLEGVFRNPAVQGALLSGGGLKLLPLIPSMLANNVTTPFTGKSLGDYLGDAVPILTSDAGNLITTSALYPAVQYKGRVALYNLKSPLGYSDNTSSKLQMGLGDNKQELTNVLLDFINPLSIKPKNKPYWLKVLTSPENSNTPFIGNIPAGAVGEFRNMIYRKALGFKAPKNNVFVKNPDGTYTVDIDKVNDVRQMYGGRKYRPHMNMYTEPVENLTLGKSPAYTKDFTTLEDVVGVGGQAWGHYVENANTGKSTGFILDVWDVQPFSDDRTIWKWGTKNIPGLKDLELVDFLGGTPPTLKITFDNPNLFLRYF